MIKGSHHSCLALCEREKSSENGYKCIKTDYSNVIRIGFGNGERLDLLTTLYYYTTVDM